MNFYDWLILSACSEENPALAAWLKTTIAQYPADCYTRLLFARCESYFVAMGNDERHEGELMHMLGILDSAGVRAMYRFQPCIERDWKELMLVVAEIMES